MPRRVWTYPADIGWSDYNLLSTIGAYVLAGGVLVFIIDLVRNFRVGETNEPNPWGAGTLEFLPQDVYSTRSIPHVTSREPLWDQPDLAAEVEAGQHYLPNAPTGGRETIVTSPIEARPQYVIQMPGPSWTHVAAAVFTAACFLLLTVKIVVPALFCAAAAIIAILIWVWEIDKGPDQGPVDIGGGFVLPVYMTGPSAHGWWAMVILMIVAGSLYLAYLFSYLYLWTVSPEVWPASSEAMAALKWPILSAAGYFASAAAFFVALKRLGPRGERRALTPVLLVAAAALMVAAAAAEFYGHYESGLRAPESSYAALVYMASVLSGEIVLAIVIMTGFCAARHFTGKLDNVRFASLENTALLAWYTAAQAILGLIVVHGFPRLVAS